MTVPRPRPAPVLRLGKVLVTGLTEEFDDTTATVFAGELTGRIAAERARGVLIDISRLEIIDSFAARALTELSTMARPLGARVIVAGMRPPVAITLAGLGLRLREAETALTAEQAVVAFGRRPSPVPR